jgi:putative transposase
MPYWRTFHHLIWATRHREPLITPPMHDALQRSIRAVGLEHHCLTHAVGIMPDHVHVAMSIPPSIAVSTLVGRLKGASSHLMNSSGVVPAEACFAWRAEYGVLSFAEMDLASVVDYIVNQPARHAGGRLSAAMESFGDTTATPSRLEPAS